MRLGVSRGSLSVGTGAANGCRERKFEQWNTWAANTLVLLNDPQLRARLIADAEQSPWSAEKSQDSVRLRFRLAHNLRALAICIEPGVPRATETASHQPVFAE